MKLTSADLDRIGQLAQSDALLDDYLPREYLAGLLEAARLQVAWDEAIGVLSETYFCDSLPSIVLTGLHPGYSAAVECMAGKTHADITSLESPTAALQALCVELRRG
jgi:hypothetical protein